MAADSQGDVEVTASWDMKGPAMDCLGYAAFQPSRLPGQRRHLPVYDESLSEMKLL